jgi:hypothetical protein
VPQLLGWDPPIGNIVVVSRSFVTGPRFNASRNIGFADCTNCITTGADLILAGDPSSINFGHK